MIVPGPHGQMVGYTAVTPAGIAYHATVGWTGAKGNGSITFAEDTPESRSIACTMLVAAHEDLANSTLWVGAVDEHQVKELSNVRALVADPFMGFAQDQSLPNCYDGSAGSYWG